MQVRHSVSGADVVSSGNHKHVVDPKTQEKERYKVVEGGEEEVQVAAQAIARD